MQNFMPWHGLAGGMLIGLSVGFYLLTTGRISGISGILEGLLTPKSAGFARNLAYVLGLPLGALIVSMVAPSVVPDVKLGTGTTMIIVAGALVGFGARLGSGCTSGHGVCGLPRLSIRSLVATGTFMAVAAVTVFIARHLI